MAIKQDDGLFLLEVLIDKIVFTKSPCFSDKDFRTCVNIECPAVEPLEICDDDPGACVAKSGGPFVKSFNNGKSCLFSLKEADISSAMSKFPIKVVVYKSLPCGCLPTKIVMGEATIDMTKEFVQARKKFLEDPTSVSYQALKDSFRLTGPGNEETGDIVMFLRISCFGKLIITRFQGSGAPPNIGAGGGGSIVDRSCQPRKDYQTKTDPCACGAARGGGGGGAGGSGAPCAAMGGGGGGMCPIARDPYNSVPCEDPDDPCYCSGPKSSGKPPMVCKNTDQYCLHVPKDCCPTGNKVIFQLPTDSCGMGHKQRAYFNFTSDGVGDVSRDEPGQLMNPEEEGYPGVVYDFPKQVIKLRIGKTVELPNRKSKLEYQFITPVISYEKDVPIIDDRTAQCIPPKCACAACCSTKKLGLPLRLPFYQQLSDQDKLNLQTCSKRDKFSASGASKMTVAQTDSQATVIVRDCLEILFDNLKFPSETREGISSFTYSAPSLYTLQSKRRSVSFSESVYSFTWPRSYYSPSDESAKSILFNNKKETTVYMTLFDDFCRIQCSGTQATASVNKCLQVYSEYKGRSSGCSVKSPNYFSTSSMSTHLLPHQNRSGILRHPEVYFFGRKKHNDCHSGMGTIDSETKLCRKEKITAAQMNRAHHDVSSTLKSQSTNVSSQTIRAPGLSASTTTGKAVSIQDTKGRCCAEYGSKPDIVATVSHVRIGPGSPCPVHGPAPCQSPKCIVATTGGEQQAPVKVSTVTNPRRGVFELVIRRMNGAPLAKNELMLEWTPPPARPPPCGSTCPVACSRPPKCKMIVCRPTPHCKPKCCKSGCKKLCSSMSSCPAPCRKCRVCSRKPSRPFKKTCPKKCKPCPPLPCSIPCNPPCCFSPCKSSPCLRPCPVGFRKARRARSQPRLKSHKKRISPCYNRSNMCPVVGCRSSCTPCFACCGSPPSCPPKKCCSIAPCRPSKCCSVFPFKPAKCCSAPPCKPPKCCKSNCSSCCGSCG